MEYFHPPLPQPHPEPLITPLESPLPAASRPQQPLICFLMNFMDDLSFLESHTNGIIFLFFLCFCSLFSTMMRGKWHPSFSNDLGTGK